MYETPHLIINSSSFHETNLSCTVKKKKKTVLCHQSCPYTERDAKRIIHIHIDYKWKGFAFTQQIGILSIAIGYYLENAGVKNLHH